MRIISGKYKGRRISPPRNLPVRPTTDMSKESLFNILNNRINFSGLKVLDLFSGTGNLSYEFGSRGADSITAVDADPAVLKDMVAAFHSRRDLVVGLLKEIPGVKINVPEGAFYVFPDVSSFFGKTLKGVEIKNADDLSMYLLEHANVATVTGDAFGNPDCIRFSYATSEDILTEALERIKEALAS